MAFSTRKQKCGRSRVLAWWTTETRSLATWIPRIRRILWAAAKFHVSSWRHLGNALIIATCLVPDWGCKRDTNRKQERMRERERAPVQKRKGQFQEKERERVSERTRCPPAKFRKSDRLSRLPIVSVPTDEREEKIKRRKNLLSWRIAVVSRQVWIPLACGLNGCLAKIRGRRKCVPRSYRQRLRARARARHIRTHKSLIARRSGITLRMFRYRLSTDGRGKRGETFQNLF